MATGSYTNQVPINRTLANMGLDPHPQATRARWRAEAELPTSRSTGGTQMKWYHFSLMHVVPFGSTRLTRSQMWLLDSARVSDLLGHASLSFNRTEMRRMHAGELGGSRKSCN